MPQRASTHDLLQHLTQVSRLSPSEAHRLVEEVCAYFTEPVEGFVNRRHQELQADGITNEVIYQQIADELAERRFPPPSLSKRQIRRLIYG